MSKEFLYKDREIISLTKMEIELVDYQEISTHIWKKILFLL